MTQTEIYPAEAPTYIARDTYVGRHSVDRRIGAVQAASFTASELAAMAPTGIFWESFGHPFPGYESFTRRRYMADAAGNLHMYDGDGARKQIHPADRSIRVLTS